MQELKLAKGEVHAIEAPGSDNISPPPLEFTIGEKEVRDERVHRRVEPNEPLEFAPLDLSYPETTVKIGSRMGLEMRQAMKLLLTEHRDVFTWGHKDTPGIDLDINQHHLCVDLRAKKIRQKRQSFSARKCAVITKEVYCLLAAGFI